MNCRPDRRTGPSRGSKAALAGTLLAAASITTPACAQSTSDNVTTDSEDAFGRQIGTERSGLYSSEYVRGLDPVEAGNARLEGLFFDKIDRLPGRIVDDTTIRVGISAQRYPFPAPTGLVDQALRLPGEEAVANINLEYGPRFRALAQVEFALPLDGETLGLSGGFSQRWRYDSEGTISTSTTYALLGEWAPFDRAQIIAFGGITSERGEVAAPILFPDGELPGKFERVRELGQPWAEKDTDRPSWGFVTKVPAGPFRLEAGIFHNERERIASFSDIASGVTADGHIAERTIVADRGAVDKSLSGELRAVTDWTSGLGSQRLIFSARGRNRDRLFGGAHRISLGESTLLERDYRPPPQFSFGPKSSDAVEQMIYGAAYSIIVGDGFGFDLGVSYSDYQKTVDFADASLTDLVSEDGRVLWNAAASYAVLNNVTVYAGISRGLEDAPIAPDRATNRSEAPPAIGTRQEEAGVRVRVTPRLTVLGGVFHIAKPYYNLDPALRFRALGDVDISGIEFSAAGSLARGLTLVAGTVFLRPEISGEAVDTGLIGSRPIGQETRRTALNLDWRTEGGRGPLSLDLAVESTSAVYTDAINALAVPSRITFDVGARYRFSLAGVPVVVRPRVENLFNEYSWLVSSSGGLTYSKPRSVSLQVLADL